MVLFCPSLARAVTAGFPGLLSPKKGKQKQEYFCRCQVVSQKLGGQGSLVLCHKEETWEVVCSPVTMEGS